jgi:intracellular sulfur oxidation DsrE/DsrF family protein
MKNYKLLSSTLAILVLSLTSMIARADNSNSNEACPVGLVSGITLANEFGIDVANNTRCIKKRHDVKTMFAIGQLYAFGATAITTGPYALNQIANVINDYEITDGMTQGKDYQIIAVVHGPGGKMLLNDPAVNPFRDQVASLIAKGVTFYFCENTVRGLMRAGFLQQGNVAAGVIPGVKYVTAGLSALSDFEAAGWSYVAP